MTTVSLKDQYTPVLKAIEVAQKKLQKVENTYTDRKATLLEKLEAEYADKREAAQAELAAAKAALVALNAALADEAAEEDEVVA